MGATATALRLDPFAVDAMCVESAIVAAQAGAPEDLSDALGLHRTRGYQLQRGDHTGIIYRILDATDRLALHPRTTPMPLLVAQKVIVLKRTLEGKDPTWLRSRWAELERMEATATARREAARDHRDRAADRQAMKDLAAIYEEMAAVDEVMLRLEGRPDPRRRA